MASIALAGKTAVVTGGSRGFGRGIVTALAGEGMRVVAVARGRAALAELAAAVDGDVVPVPGDVTDAALATITLQRERPSVLVLNAGAKVPIQEARYLTWEAFSANWDVDVRGAFTWAREALLAPLAPGSTILMMASDAAGSRTMSIAGYIAAKTAQVALARCLAVEAEPLGIRVAYLMPYLTSETDIGRESVQTFARRAGLDEAALMERLGVDPRLTPDLMGRVVVDILTHPDHAAVHGFRVLADGLAPLAPDAPIMVAGPVPRG